MKDIMDYIDLSIGNILRRIRTLETQDPIYPPVQIASANANLVLTPAWQDIPNCTVTLLPGNYIIFGLFSYTDMGDSGFSARGGLTVDGILQSSISLEGFIAGATMTGSQQWYVSSTDTTIVVLQASKTGGAGASFINQVNTNIIALESR